MSGLRKGIVSREDYRRYRGVFVALDGWPQKGKHARVVGSGENFNALETSLREIGRSFEDVIIMRIPPESTDCLVCTR